MRSRFPGHGLPPGPTKRVPENAFPNALPDGPVHPSPDGNSALRTVAFAGPPCYQAAMSDSPVVPVVGVSASRHFMPSHTLPHHGAGERYVLAVSGGAGALPVVVPALGEDLDAAALADRLDGLFLTGGRANVEPHHYGGPPFPDDEIRDPLRDRTVLPLVRECVARGVPVFGSCRGIQEINVALGGTLHYRTHLVPGHDDHRMPREGDIEHKMGPRHPVVMAENGLFHRLLGAREAVVNSLHGQSVDAVAPELEVECVSPDGVIEGLSRPGTFCVGVQWHVEWRYETHALSSALLRAFGDACRGRAMERTGYPVAAE